MATQYVKATVSTTSIDALASLLDAEANISSALVVPPYESDGLTNPGTTKDTGTTLILVTGTTDAAIDSAIAAVAGTAKVTNALASADAET